MLNYTTLRCCLTIPSETRRPELAEVDVGCTLETSPSEREERTFDLFLARVCRRCSLTVLYSGGASEISPLFVSIGSMA